MRTCIHTIKRKTENRRRQMSIVICILCSTLINGDTSHVDDAIQHNTKQCYKQQEEQCIADSLAELICVWYAYLLVPECVHDI